MRNVTDTNLNISFNLWNIADHIIFIDDGPKELPPLSVLARFRVVLTSYNRFTAEWKHGNVEQESRASKKSSGGGVNYWGDDVPDASSLLKVSWLREMDLRCYFFVATPKHIFRLLIQGHD